MSEKLGMISYGDNSQEVFLGHSVTQNKNVSEVTAREIDTEVKGLIDRAYAHATQILTEHLDELHRLARGLLEYETLSGDEIRIVLRGEPVIRKVGGRAGAGVPPGVRADDSAGRAAADGWVGAGAAAGLTCGERHCDEPVMGRPSGRPMRYGDPERHPGQLQRRGPASRSG